MAFGAIRSETSSDEFARLHRIFVEHMTIALGLVWATAIYAALHAPWVRNIRGLIDPLGRPESTASFIFGLPVLMSVAWVFCAAGGEVMRRSRLLKNQSIEFATAGLVVFVVFCMSLDRAVTAVLLAG